MTPGPSAWHRKDLMNWKQLNCGSKFPREIQNVFCVWHEMVMPKQWLDKCPRPFGHRMLKDLGTTCNDQKQTLHCVAKRKTESLAAM